MLLHTAFGPRWERLGDLAPAAAGIPEVFEPLLLRRRPRRVRSALLGDGAWQMRLRRPKAKVYIAGPRHEALRVPKGTRATARRARRLAKLRDAPLARVDGRLLGLLMLLLDRLMRLQRMILRLLGKGEASRIMWAWRIWVGLLIWILEAGDV